MRGQLTPERTHSVSFARTSLDTAVCCLSAYVRNCRKQAISLKTLPRWDFERNRGLAAVEGPQVQCQERFWGSLADQENI